MTFQWHRCTFLKLKVTQTMHGLYIWKQIFEYVADMYSHAPLKRKRDEGEILPHGLHAN